MRDALHLPGRILGIDAGGSGTRVVVLENGTVTPQPDEPPMNVLLTDGFAGRLLQIIKAADVTAAGVGLAGLRQEAQAAELTETLTRQAGLPGARHRRRGHRPGRRLPRRSRRGRDRGHGLDGVRPGRGAPCPRGRPRLPARRRGQRLLDRPRRRPRRAALAGPAWAAPSSSTASSWRRREPTSTTWSSTSAPIQPNVPGSLPWPPSSPRSRGRTPRRNGSPGRPPSTWPRWPSPSGTVSARCPSSAPGGCSAPASSGTGSPS